ncbi:hypothetical protein HDK90DRAFT_260635 [Phyllosticta capitalensis]|uniref:Cytochrome b5 heme-binding domain-containing protein n=1 Tax=Phyllosticta capitalensis TaxID=121624 RepID=A0ABR1YR87_9PEZI
MADATPPRLQVALHRSPSRVNIPTTTSPKANYIPPLCYSTLFIMADNGMRDANHAEEPKRFEPKKPVQLDPPKDDPITPEYLAKCNGRSSSSGRTSVTVLIQFVGTNEGYPTLVAIKGTVFDVTKNEAYGPTGQYKVFAGKEPNRALAQSSLKPDDCVPEWEDLPDKEKTVLDEWFIFFSKRYNVVGKVQRANLSNLAKTSNL